MKEIEEILKLAKSKGIVCKGSDAMPIWSEPGIMYIIRCELYLIKAVMSSNKTWSIIIQ